jgi:hypothetical protein
VIGGGADAGPQGRAQTRTRVQVGILAGASREQTQGQQQYHQELRRSLPAKPTLLSIHDSFLPKQVCLRLLLL